MIAIYCRVSTDDQQERGTIENQIEFAQKYCDLHELSIFKIYKEDGVSGTIALEDRPVGKQLLKDAKNKKFDTLLLYKLDRLGRSARITLNSIHTLEELNVQIKSMTEPFDTSSPSGRFMITMLAGVADLERSTILERMQLGTNRAAKEGKWLGGIVPYGYYVDDDKYLQINNDIIPGLNLSEADIIKLIFNLTVEKHYSTIKICDYLNAMNIPTSYEKDNRKISKGKRKVNTAGVWRPGNVLRMLRNTTYKGIHSYGKRSNKKRDLITREVPSIVDIETWEKAQQVIEDNKIEANRNHKRDYLLKGLIKCALCARTYVGTTHGERGYYVCNGKISYRGKCKAKNVSTKYIESIVWNDITSFINNPGETIEILKRNLKSKHDGRVDLLKQKELLDNHMRDKQNEKQSILDLFRKGIINHDDLELQMNKINAEYNNIKNNLDTLIIELEALNDIEDYTRVEEMLGEMKIKISNPNISFEDKRKIIKVLVDKILVDTVEENNSKKAVLNITYSFVQVEKHTVTHEVNYLDNMYNKFDIQKSYTIQNNNTSTSSNRIRQARLSKSLTIKQVSIQTNLTETQLHNIETDKSTPSISTLKKLESVLDKDIWYLGNYDSLEENTLGKRIYKCRLFLGHGRKEFAQILGVGYRSLEKWERDLITPSKKNMDILKKYINKLHIICRKKL